MIRIMFYFLGYHLGKVHVNEPKIETIVALLNLLQLVQFNLFFYSCSLRKNSNWLLSTKYTS